MITAPTQISNCQVWLDASDRTTLFQLSGGTTAVAANLDPVGYWGDKSGNARHFTNIGGSATTRPTWVSSLSTVRFDGTNDYLSSFFNITYTAQTVFLVVTKISGAASSIDQRVYTQNSSTGQDIDSNRHIPCWIPNGARGTYASYTNLANRSSVTNRGNNIYDVFTSRFTATELTNFLNGVAGSSSTGLTLNLAATISRLGSRISSGAGEYFAGDISEVIVYNRALTDLERADVEYYLTRKWNFLNSIPRQAYAIKNGLWSDSATWSVSAEPSPWNFPLSADNAYTNTFTVTADSSTKVDTIRNSALSPNISAGGSFVLANGVSLSANVAPGVAPFTLTLAPAASSTLIGNVFGGGIVAVPALSCGSTSSVTIVGNLSGGSNAQTWALVNTSVSPIFIIGDIRGGSAGNPSIGVVHANGSMTLTGNVYGGSGGTNSYGITQSSGVINVNGNIEGTSFTGIDNLGGIINVVGNVLGSSTGNGVGVTTGHGTSQIISLTGNITGRNAAAINIATSANTRLSAYNGNITASNASNAVSNAGTTSTVLTFVSCNILNAPNGRQAIYAPRYQVFPSASATYTRQAVNGYDSYADYWTSNATFSYPASSDVVLSTVYNNNTLSGSMALPPTSAVALGASVGTTSGTAAPLTLDGILNQSVATLNTPNSIGARLKNVATTQALSAVVNSLDFNN